MKQLAIQAFLFLTMLIVGAGIWGMCRLLRCKPVDPGIPDPRKSSFYALASVGCSMAVLVFGMLMQRASHVVTTHGATPGNGMPLSMGSKGLMSQCVVLIIYCLPAGLLMLKRREPLRSAGLTMVNFWSSLFIGATLALLTMCFYPGGLLAKLRLIDSHHGVALLYFAFVGFGEEFLFRGYLQVRLAAWRGKAQGLVLASTIMALAHLPARFLLEGQPLSKAFLSSCADVPGSLLFGFIMLCTGNIMASGIFHTFANWVETLQ